MDFKASNDNHPETIGKSDVLEIFDEVNGVQSYSRSDSNIEYDWSTERYIEHEMNQPF